MKPLAVLAFAVGVLIAAIGFVGVLAPLAVLGFGRSLLSPSAIYIIAALRIAIGVLLLWVASGSRMPTTLRAIGVIVVVAGLVTPLFGVERSEAVIAWLSGQDALTTRAIFVLPMIFGVFLTYVVSGRRIAA